MGFVVCLVLVSVVGQLFCQFAIVVTGLHAAQRWEQKKKCLKS